MHTNGEEPAGDRRGAADGDGATRVFARSPEEAERTARFVRDSEADDHARTFVRPPRGWSAPPPDQGPEATREFSRHPRPEPPDADTGPAGPGRPRRRRGPLRRIGVLLASLVLVVLMLPVATWAWVWYTARQDERPASDAIVVLGASQYNGRPSPVFEARLEHAAHLYEQGVAPVVVTVGGNQPGDNFTEGGSGGRWLADAGVPADRITAIGDGSDTLESLELVALAFRERGWDTAVIVSDPWHSLRSRQMAEDFGIDAATSPARSGPAVLERETQLWYITRETASLWHYWIVGDSATVRVDAL